MRAGASKMAKILLFTSSASWNMCVHRKVNILAGLGNMDAALEISFPHELSLIRPNSYAWTCVKGDCYARLDTHLVTTVTLQPLQSEIVGKPGETCTDSPPSRDLCIQSE